MKIISAIYQDISTARKVIHDLEGAGFRKAQILINSQMSLADHLQPTALTVQAGYRIDLAYDIMSDHRPTYIGEGDPEWEYVSGLEPGEVTDLYAERRARNEHILEDVPHRSIE